MAIERLFDALSERTMCKVAELSQESAALFSQGKREEGQQKTKGILRLIEQTGVLEDIRSSVLAGLERAGIQQPLVGFLNEIVVEEKSKVVRPHTRFERLEQSEAAEAPLPQKPTETGERAEKPSSETKPEKVVITTAARNRDDLGEREEEIANALFKIKSTRDGFTNNTSDLALLSAYAGIIKGTDGSKERRNHLYQLRPAFKRSVLNIIRKLQEAWTIEVKPPHTARLIEYIKSQPEYANLTLDELAAVAKRKMSFEQIQKPTRTENPTLVEETTASDKIEVETPETPGGEEKREVLTPDEVYCVARVLRKKEAGVLEALGIRIARGDEEELQKIMNKHTEYRGRPIEISEGLKNKLLSFSDNPREIFLDNLGDEDAQYVLTLLSGLNREKIATLFGLKSE